MLVGITDRLVHTQNPANAAPPPPQFDEQSERPTGRGGAAGVALPGGRLVLVGGADRCGGRCGVGLPPWFVPTPLLPARPGTPRRTMTFGC